jgi:hypothetical protein
MEPKMNSRERTYISVLFVVLFIMAIVGALCLIFVPLHALAAPAQVPYLDGCKGGICTVFWPGVSGYNDGYLVVVNACTGEGGALYLNWQPVHPLSMGRFTTSPSQLLYMGACSLYVVTDGYLGLQEIYLPTEKQVFSFLVWRLGLAEVRR